MPKLVGFHTTGVPEVLKVEDLPLAEPGDGESAMVPAAAAAPGATIFEYGALARGKRHLHDGLRAGKLKPVIDRTLSMDAIVAAHRSMESNRQKGKIVDTV